MGLFADRRFYKEDIIGIYYGEFRKDKYNDGDYGYQLCSIDAKKGLGGKPFMGMHFINNPF